MKIWQGFKEERTQAHVLATVMYIFGILCDGFGYLNLGIEVVGLIFLAVATIFSIALFIKAVEYTKKYVKLAIMHLSFVIFNIIALFVFYFLKMYWSFIGVTCLTGVIAILYIIDLCCIYDIYNS